MESRHEGGCACGGMRYRLASKPMFVHCCHCRDCQRQTGSAFVINALIETDRVELLSGETEAVAIPTDSGRPHLIHRCPIVQGRASGAITAGGALELRSRRHARRALGAPARRAYLYALESALGGAARGRSGFRSLLRLEALWPAGEPRAPQGDLRLTRAGSAEPRCGRHVAALREPEGAPIPAKRGASSCESNRWDYGPHSWGTVIA